jgi:hypothetical protein
VLLWCYAVGECYARDAKILLAEGNGSDAACRAPVVEASGEEQNPLRNPYNKAKAWSSYAY